jgi:hypothetical protein
MSVQSESSPMLFCSTCSLSWQGRSTCGACVRLAQRSKSGQPFFGIMRKRSGQVIFLQITDLFFRSLFAFFIIELKSRRVIHVGVTRSPTDAWTAQQLWEATRYGHTPKYLIRENDGKFGHCSPMSQQRAASSHSKHLTTHHEPMPFVNAFWGVSVESA